MNLRFSGLILAFFMASNLFSQERLTVAESSNYTQTSDYTQVMEIVEWLDEQSEFIRIEEVAETIEERKVPMLVIANPMIYSVEELKNDKRIVVYIQSNIHAGEVEGKEASLMLARDILKKENQKYLKDAIVLIVPNLNADGNEKRSDQNRTHQNGPKVVGIRYNGQNLDLNRDALKLESPEIRGVVSNILNKWDPSITVDCHTTNGSFHEEPITFTWMMNPNGDRQLINYMRDNMMPEVHKTLGDKYQTLNCYYGEFVDRLEPQKGWISYAAEPRYLVNYIGVRNRLAILNENYVYADYKSRVQGCYNLLWSILDYAVENKKEIKDLLQEADNRTIARAEQEAVKDSFAITYKGYPTPDSVTILAFEAEYSHTENGWKRYKKTDRKITVTAPYIADYFAESSISYPKAYVLNKPINEVVELLDIHGVKYSRLEQEATMHVEEFLFSKISPANRLNQGHYPNHIEGEWTQKEKIFSEGDILIPMNQPLANLISYLFEAKADDGLLKWNFFDRYIVPQWGSNYYPYPVYRVLD
ncbi:M14 family metallopeptidase [Carboxylicivirga linearis]|uniref:Peptidase M14 domain-containing protein n=1 Tax=Carboxylicivirga linearis TaxID=1628157 RepID=A0ABS5JWK3_9BACT|nr:M14 family metallopeptidase [Carboxylicivirga linearis]MBS2098726.1 hypothetical protein [Carboxylicivirga linearis]